MGTCHSEKLYCIVIEICLWCIQHDVWLTAAPILGPMNIIADQESRKISSDLEWVLDLKIYKEAVELCDFTPNIDLFASRLNKKRSKLHSQPPKSRCTSSQRFHPIVVWAPLLCLSSIQYNFEDPSYDPGGQSHRDSGRTTLANSVLVAKLN